MKNVSRRSFIKGLAGLLAIGLIPMVADNEPEPAILDPDVPISENMDLLQANYNHNDYTHRVVYLHKSGAVISISSNNASFEDIHAIMECFEKQV